MTLFKVTIPKGCHVLLLEDSEMRIAWFKSKITHLKVVSTVADFKAYFDTRLPVDFIFFDHDLGEGNGTGLEAVQFMKEKFGGSRWGVVHSWNRPAAQRMLEVLPNIPHIPFGEFDIEEVG
jgi:hypothetical protein